MRNIAFTAWFTVFIFISFHVCSQPHIGDTCVVVNSLEGKRVTVYVKPDYVKKRLSIQLSPSETIYFTKFLNIKEIKIYDRFMAVSFEQFMPVAYNNPDGDKITFVKTMLFCVSGGHVYNAMNNMPNSEGSSEVGFSLQNDKNGEYQLTETDHYEFPNNSGKPREFFDSIGYSFDKKNKVFYRIPKHDKDMDEDKTITINSLDGTPETIHIISYYPAGMLTIQLSPSETIRCKEFIDIKTIKTFDNFIYVEYKVRCGSNCGEGKTVFVCVSKGHLYDALDITSHQDYDLSQVYDREADSLGLFDEHGLFQVQFNNLQNCEEGNYHLCATQYEKVKNKHDFFENHETSDSMKFSFDKKNKVFYNRYITLQGNYTIESESGNKEKVFSGEKYPEIELKNHGKFFSNYVFIDGHWYNSTENENQILYGPLDVCN